MRKLKKVFLLFAFICCEGATALQYATAADAVFDKVVVYDKISKQPMQADSFVQKCKELNSRYRLSFGRSIDILEDFKSNLRVIEQNPNGQALLNRITILIEVLKALDEATQYGFDGKIHITLDDLDGISFTGYPKINKNRFRTGDQKMSVQLNLNYELNIVYNDKYGLGCIVPALRLHRSGKFLEIADCFDPLWIVIAHELIHMEHFLLQELNKFTANDPVLVRPIAAKHKNSGIDILDKLNSEPDDQKIKTFCDDQSRFHARYSQNKLISGSANLFSLKLPKILEDFPELRVRQRSGASQGLFGDLEERETVIGSRCSELTLRICATDNNMPIRYLYQPQGTYFFEDIDVILEILNKARTSMNLQPLKEEEIIQKFQSNNNSDLFNLGLFSRLVSTNLLPDGFEENLNKVMKEVPPVKGNAANRILISEKQTEQDLTTEDAIAQEKDPIGDISPNSNPEKREEEENAEEGKYPTAHTTPDSD